MPTQDVPPATWQQYLLPLPCWAVIICVGIYANPPHAFTDIYAVLKFICVFAYIYCVYVSLYAKKKSSRLGIKKIKMPVIPRSGG